HAASPTLYPLPLHDALPISFGSNEALFNIYARQRGEQLYNEDGSLGFSARTLADFWTLAVEQTKRGGTPPADETVEIGATGPDRSEEHTSELQSRENLVCRL